MAALSQLKQCYFPVTRRTWGACHGRVTSALRRHGMRKARNAMESRPPSDTGSGAALAHGASVDAMRLAASLGPAYAKTHEQQRPSQCSTIDAGEKPLIGPSGRLREVRPLQCGPVWTNALQGNVVGSSS